jgi:predicted transcriptional regulator
MGSSGKTSKVIVAAALATALIPTSTFALVKEGASAPNAKVEDADGKVLQMQSLKGKPILIVYEDRDSSKQNQPLKDDLAKLASGDKYKKTIALAAIADVSSYDWWPAKGFVKDAIKEESKKQKTTIYCDWDGGFRKAYGIKKGVSNIILVGRDGQVLFAVEGAMSADSRKRLVSLLGEQVNGS